MPGIGKIKTVATKARTGRNPRTGQTIEIPAGRRLTVSAFRDFKEALRGDA
ncbi:MAG: HU family DNA-binding protein [Desulfovibrio sp.]|nr:HU family DNA-binding protein [Desulfovibrio sp.]